VTRGTSSHPEPITTPSTIVVLVRGLLRRCPRCGRGALFDGWFRLAERCPRCGLAFERGEGYWLGAMAINLGVTEAVFGALLVVWAVLAWPDVPWVWVTVAGLAVNAVFPVFFYPFSKTVFIAIDLVLIHAEDRGPSTGRPAGGSPTARSA
jgi:uncharacterized protein (DUF983 family)